MNVFVLGNDVRRLDTVRRILVIGNGEVGFQVSFLFFRRDEFEGLRFWDRRN